MSWLLKQGWSPQHTVSWTNRQKEQQWLQELPENQVLLSAECHQRSVSHQSWARSKVLSDSIISSYQALRVNASAMRNGMGGRRQDRNWTGRGHGRMMMLTKWCFTLLYNLGSYAVSQPQSQQFNSQLKDLGKAKLSRKQNSSSTSSSVRCFNKVSSAHILKTGQFPSFNIA